MFLGASSHGCRRYHTIDVIRTTPGRGNSFRRDAAIHRRRQTYFFKVLLRTRMSYW